MHRFGVLANSSLSSSKRVGQGRFLSQAQASADVGLITYPPDAIFLERNDGDTEDYKPLLCENGVAFCTSAISRAQTGADSVVERGVAGTFVCSRRGADMAEPLKGPRRKTCDRTVTHVAI